MCLVSILFVCLVCVLINCWQVYLVHVVFAESLSVCANDLLTGALGCVRFVFRLLDRSVYVLVTC